MSRRVAPDTRIAALQLELAQLREASLATDSALGQDVSAPSKESAGQAFEALNQTEQAAASLGVNPESWRPIGFLNQSHYNTLRKNNALDDTLVRRIEAFRAVALQG